MDVRVVAGRIGGGALSNTLSEIEPTDPLADQAYSLLSTAILQNELTPGSSLSVPELAKRMGISRSPVREAVLRLIWNGLATYRGRRGTVVSKIDLAEFEALLEVREPLEGLAARCAAQRGTVEERDDLFAVHSQLESLDPVDDPRPATFIEIDMRFHTLILQMARNSELETALSRIQCRGHLSLYSLWRGPRNVRAARTEHHDLCQAIIAGDEDQADYAARAHVASLRRRLVEQQNQSSPE